MRDVLLTMLAVVGAGLSVALAADAETVRAMSGWLGCSALCVTWIVVTARTLPPPSDDDPFDLH